MKKPGLAKNEPGSAAVFSRIYKAPASCSKSAQSKYIPQASRTSCRFSNPLSGGQHQRPGKAGSAVFLEGARPSYQPTIMTTPSTRKIAAEMPCTSLIGTRLTIFSPSQTTGALASIIPSVVPATTQK